nr:MAG TPA: hypothetical protein [Caudoviricetes sp.]
MNLPKLFLRGGSNFGSYQWCNVCWHLYCTLIANQSQLQYLKKLTFVSLPKKQGKVLEVV